MQSANFELTPSWDDPAVLVTTGLSPRRIWGYVHRNGEWFLIGDESLRPGQMHRAESFEAAQAAALKAAEAQLAHERANARLIAAAPDLLRALQDLDAWGNTPNDATNAASHTYRVWKQCADAIAAATGTEPDYSDLDDPGDIAAHEAALAELAAERDT
jgi:hypothetical protein